MAGMASPKAAPDAPYWSAGLPRQRAAAYCGHSPNHFDKLVREGIYPPARDANGVKVWLRWELDTALAALPVIGGPALPNSCDEAFGC